MGGDPAGDINHDEHDFALWEKRVDALMVLASSPISSSTRRRLSVFINPAEEASTISASTRFF